MNWYNLSSLEYLVLEACADKGLATKMRMLEERQKKKKNNNNSWRLLTSRHAEKIAQHVDYIL